ncbi:MAG: penicillin-binding protein 2 [Longimicrobiales bacterium]
MDRRPRIEQPRGQRRRRGGWARIAIGLLTVTLAWGLFRVQVAAGDRYETIAKENRMRPIVVRAPRGTIYDRHGRVVAENIVGYRVMLMPAPLDSLRKQVSMLAPVLGMDSADVAYAFRKYGRSPNYPMIVTDDADPVAVARLMERRTEFPQALIHQYPKRHYPAGPAVAHFIGYVAEISESELEQPEFADYVQGRWIGKAGLERTYEDLLGGEPGVRYLEVDAKGRIKRWLPEEMGVPPIPGEDLQLYLDIDLQKYMAEIFPKQYNGGMIAIEPQTGGVLGYYSNPSYDPNEFVGGISGELYRSLLENEDKPLLDRVVGSAQPPASTWKIAVAAMALDVGAITPEEYMPIPCSGGMSYAGRYARCWGVHGRMNLVAGIKNSCDVYFYQVGIKIGFERYLETASRFGLSEETGIDVPHEVAPFIPASPQWWVEELGYTPLAPEIMSMAIGQGPQIMTPVKMAHLYAAIVQPDGTVPAPRLAMNGGLPRDTFSLNIDATDVWYIEAGLRRVVGPGGTAYLSRLPEWDLMGKTGTAQACANCPLPDHAWFVGVGKHPDKEEAEIVVAIFLEHGLHGSDSSGYVAEAIAFYLDRKYGHPFVMWQTPRERNKNGLSADWSQLGRPIVDPPFPGTGSPAVPR